MGDGHRRAVEARRRAHLLAGDYDAGLTHLHYAHEHPESLRVEEFYGAVDTTWVVYGPRKRFAGEVIGQRNPWLFVDDARAGALG